jgi:glycosyltransferase involved in cell wall biosynthesis
VLPALPDRDAARVALGLNGVTLAAAGRLTRQKALGDALAALARVDGVSLVLAGDGPERRALERRAGELGVDGRVHFLGPLARDDVLTLFRAADAALLTSAWENLPHSVVEALAVGTPVVATAARTGSSSPRATSTRSPTRSAASPSRGSAARSPRRRPGRWPSSTSSGFSRGSSA